MRILTTVGRVGFRATLTWSTLIVAFLAARVTYVWAQRDIYLSAPSHIVDFRDGGAMPMVGLVVGWTYALIFIKASQKLRKVLAITLGVVGIVWMLAFTTTTLSSENAHVEFVAVPQSILDGGSLLAAFNGKPTIVNLWATWCPPCLSEIPLLRRVQADHPEINVVFLNQGELAVRVQSFLTSQALHLRNVMLDPTSEVGHEIDGRDLSRTLFFDADGHPVDTNALPRTFFFDAEGRFMNAHLGELTSAGLDKLLQRLIGPDASLP